MHSFSGETIPLNITLISECNGLSIKIKGTLLLPLHSEMNVRLWEEGRKEASKQTNKQTQFIVFYCKIIVSLTIRKENKYFFICHIHNYTV